MDIQLIFLLWFCSFLEEDPLFIAYADMMAKVSVGLNPINPSKFNCYCFKELIFNQSKFSFTELCWEWGRRRRRGRKRKNFWGIQFLN